MSPEFLILSFVILVAIFFFMTELGARISYRRNFGAGYKAKRFAEYPYYDFIECCDPPEIYCMKKGYHSQQVNTNRFGLRGPEPAADGQARRLLFIGESNIFGAKIKNEEQLWSNEMLKLLKANDHNEWEIINGGIPVFNSVQHQAYWSRVLDQINPSAMLVSLGYNDIAQAWHFGDDWAPGKPWPESIARAKAGRRSLMTRFLELFCIYFFVSHLMKPSTGPSIKAAEIDWERCKSSILDNYRWFANYARQHHIPIAFTTTAPVYSEGSDTSDETAEAENHRLAALQLNYSAYLDYYRPCFLDLRTSLKDSADPDLEVPFIDLYAAFMANTRRFSCYYDLINWNHKGMTYAAKTLYQELFQLGWWK